MENWLGKVAVVTGASLGIGKGITTELVNRGMTVVGLARRENLLQDLNNELQNTAGKFHLRVVDLTKEDDILAAFAWIEETLGGIHLMINNAGLINYSSLTDGKTSDWKNLIDIHVLSTAICSREAIKSMKKHGINDGIILNINSMAGHNIPKVAFVPAMYTASKFALTVITEGLRRELIDQKSSIRVTSVSPGLVKTEGNNDMPGFSNIPSLNVNDIAAAVVFIIESPSKVEINEIIITPVSVEVK